MNIGYARVSTQDQNLDLQNDALKAAGCENIYTDKMSGAKTERPGLEKIMSFIREGDTLVVWKLDRLGRSLKHLIQIMNQLEERGIYFKSVQESLDTSTPGGKLIFHVRCTGRIRTGYHSRKDDGRFGCSKSTWKGRGSS